MPYLKKPHKKPVRRVSREERQQVYQSIQWKKLREAKLMEQPLCEICLKQGIITPASDVHHRDSFQNYDGLVRLQKAFDFSNLQSVCKQCHAALHKNGKTNG